MRCRVIPIIGCCARLVGARDRARRGCSPRRRAGQGGALGDLNRRFLGDEKFGVIVSWQLYSLPVVSAVDTGPRNSLVLHRGRCLPHSFAVESVLRTGYDLLPRRFAQLDPRCPDFLTVMAVGRDTRRHERDARRRQAPRRRSRRAWPRSRRRGAAESQPRGAVGRGPGRAISSTNATSPPG